MPDNYVGTFELDNTNIKVKDNEARTSIATINSDLGALQNRVTSLEGLARLSVSYNASTETIAFTTTA